MFTEKHKLFHQSIVACSDIEAEIAQHEVAIEALRAKLAQAEAERDARASEAAEEKLAAGANAIEMPDGSLRLVSKARRGRKTEAHPDGTPPKHPFVVSDKVVRT